MPRIDLVVAPLRAASAALAHLQCHRVGEGLAGLLAPDGVAVEVHQAVQLGQRQAAMRPQDRQAGGAEPPTAQSHRVSADGRQRRLTRPCRLPSVETVDVPEQVVGMLDALEDLSALPRPRDRLLIVGMQCRSELGEVLVDLGPLPKIERRPPDVVDRRQRSHGSSSVCVAEEVRTAAKLEML